MKELLLLPQRILDMTKGLDFLAPLMLRLYLGIVFLTFGLKKYYGFEGVVEWFGNEDWGLGLPFPTLMAALAVGTELVGGVFLILGAAVRYFCIPLMVTMLVAIFTVHWKDGWYAVHPTSPDTHAAYVLSPFGFPGAEDALEETKVAKRRSDKAKEILKEHGNYDWLTGSGTYVINNNGIEWAATYFIMLLSLFFMGAGRFVSIDYWVRRKVMKDL
jgi:putative oxidoreductase